MNITFRQLRVFEAVARELSYTRAAESLHMTQPAASMQVKQLEGQVGLPLFEQLGKKIYLTEAGQELLQYSHAIFNHLEELEDVLEGMRGLNRGRLRIAVASTINYFAPRVLAAFNRLYPDVSLNLEVTNREKLMRMLDANEKDLVLMGQPPENLDLEYDPFMENPLVVIAPPSHPLANEKQIPMQRLEEETFVMREKGSGTRLAMERFFQEHQIELHPGLEMTRNEAIKQAVRSGMGLSVVSTRSIELELETKRLVALDVEGFPLMRYWYIVHRKGKRLTPAAQAFRAFLLEEADHLADSNE
ncbi:LysR family transcriptional regulator [Solemya pervernicosa gill symbiont]|uniref:LysR family transcriptional regulator n=2 Tax=Gammaproteobacteria incertae sedis TaxID=118884 RepID=A0A1T2L5H9_9GAMM|nr:LysR family transcriptional regulator [Candidatus Reidiella endopervernicosa]OOZ40333.1 LysR family transcriptional regulator [Solemya pervernicosa gill symbiont]QKQ24858.1 LysR family transcriptional regulator [Candidatus Reidiella endopervernicosa]